jgi:hypothetical protein
MTREEHRVRDQLAELAATEKGRQLLQLALRGIQESGRGLTYGCWVKQDGGVSGCLFQHAYWQGVSEGVFAVREEPTNGLLRVYVGDEDFALVMGSIRAFDSLGKRRFMRWEVDRGLPRRRLDEERWHATIERILVDVLAGSDAAGVREETSPRLPELSASTGGFIDA